MTTPESGHITGTVVDRIEGMPLPGVVIDLVHVPTNTRWETVSDAEGRWSVDHVRLGGPYDATATLEGFRPQRQEGMMLDSGQTLRIDFQLGLETEEEYLAAVPSRVAQRPTED